MERFLSWLRSSLETPAVPPARLSAKDALGFSFMAQSVRGIRAIPILALLLAILVLLAFVVGKIGFWVVLVVTWLVMGGVLFHVRDRFRWSNLRDALATPEQGKVDAKSDQNARPDGR